MSLQREPQRHLKIAEFLKEQIRKGDLAPGDQLPSEAELCAQFNSSRGPVRQAMAALRAEGAISSGRGRRSVVLGNHQAETFESIYSVTEWMKLRGFKAGQRTLWQARRPAPARVAKALAVEEGEPIIFIHRVRYANDEPVLVERQYFPLEIGSIVLHFDADAGSVHDHLAESGVDFDNVRRELVIDHATEEDADALGIEPGSALWQVRVAVSDHSGRPVEYAENRYRADSLAFGLSSVRGGTSPLEVMLTHQSGLLGESG